jgi:hypothetical protein
MDAFFVAGEFDSEAPAAIRATYPQRTLGDFLFIAAIATTMQIRAFFCLPDNSPSTKSLAYDYRWDGGNNSTVRPLQHAIEFNGYSRAFP